MRYECDDPAFAGSFIEFSESWSRGEVRAAWAAKEVDLLDILRRKITALYLPCVNGDPITDPDDLTPERLGDVDTRLYTWFANAWIKCMDDLANLGNALGRQLFVTSAGLTPTTQAKATGTKAPTKTAAAPARRKR